MTNSNKSNNATPQSTDILTTRRPRGYSPGGPLVLDQLNAVNALPDVAGGQPNLMDIRTLYTQGVMCTIPEWGDLAPFPGVLDDELQIYINNVPYGDRVAFSHPLSALTWPYSFAVPEQDIGEHGVKNISYEVFFFGGTIGSDRPSTPTPVTIDRLDPNARLLNDPAELEAWVGETLTLEGLASNGNQLIVTIPGRIDPQVGDRLLVYWNMLDAVPIFMMDNLPRSNAPVPFTLTTAQIVAQGGGMKYIAYRYTDRAGNNTTWPGDVRRVIVITSPSPAGLLPPRVPEAPIDLTDAQLRRAEVFIDAYTNPAIGDDILVEFNGIFLIHTITSLTWPQRVEITWDVLRAGGLDAPYTADVSYRVVRDGSSFGPSATIPVDVDLRSAGGRPEDPGPVNPLLDTIEVESAEGLIDEIGPGDTGDAIARFDVYTGATAGHRIQIYWKGLPALAPPYTVTVADETAAQFELIIPASVIAAGQNGLVPVWYELNNGINTNVISSLETPVQVNAAVVENLTLIELLDARSIGAGIFIITCDQGIPNGIRTRILDPDNLRTGDRITMHWVVYGPDSLTSTTVVVDEVLPEVTVTGDHNVPGHPGELFTVPFPVFIQPVTTGRIEAYYTVLKADGVTTGESDPNFVYMNRRRADNSVCG